MRNRPQRSIAVSDGSSLPALYEDVSAAIEAGEFVSAAELADHLIEQYPRNADGFVFKSQALAGLNRMAEALETLRAALEADPSSPPLLRAARNLAFGHGGIEAAAEYALRLSALIPGDLKNELYVTDWYLAAGQSDAALERADTLIKGFPESAQASMRKAQALLLKGRSEDALRVLRDALRGAAENRKLLTLAREIAFRMGHIREAKDFAVKLLGLAPDDRKNRNFLIQACLAIGDFDEALAHATALVHASPNDVRAVMLKAQALVAVHRVRDALSTLQEALSAHASDRRLLRLARSVAFQNGRFEEAAVYAARLIEPESGDLRNEVFLVQCYMAAVRFDEVERLFSATKVRGLLKEEQRYYHGFRRLIDTAPALASAWQLALNNSVEHSPASATRGRELGATMIQYWSQGSPPDDVQTVCDNWKSLLQTEQLGRLELFDRASAIEWIRANAPEFLGQFSAAFHYAMESDIFRLAYASKRPCIYMDIDSWPLEHSAAIIRFAAEKSGSMLYLRAHRPTILNGFFVSTPNSPFFKKLIEECLAIDLSSMPKNYLTLEGTFGPTRYGKVFEELVRSSHAASASTVTEVPGCSVISLDGTDIYFSHEAAVASVRPPFPLGYKVTDGYWKYMSAGDQ